jgi:hypothetical protein
MDVGVLGAGASRRWIHVGLVGAIGVGLAAIGGLLPRLPAEPVVLGALAVALGIGVALHPPLAAYLLVGVTPLVAGIDRGRLIPVLRPAEALELLAGGALLARALILARDGAGTRWKMRPLDAAILALAVTSSILPLAWMLVRGVAIAQDDVLYALIIWKYYGLFVIVRASVRTDREIRTLLVISVGTGLVVAIVGIVQSLQLLGVPRLLSSLYSPYGNTEALTNNRGGSTLALPIAAADLLLLNLGIVLAAWPRLSRGWAWLAAGIAAVFTTGIVASGEISAIVGLVVVLVALVWVSRRSELLLRLLPGLLLAVFVLGPVIQRRLAGFQSSSGLPLSWQGRLFNLTNYFWPVLFSHGNFLLGVRPAARVPTSAMATGFVWIESGYTWLLWAGGIPLLIAFFVFAGKALRLCATVARSNPGMASIAASSAFASLVMILLLMLIDPHLTYRGSADLLFALLAVCSTPIALGSPWKEERRR